jgi:FAD/FMN-containing dehydrogenase
MLPRSGGTSLAGQCVNRAVVIDVSNHLRGISDLDVDSRTVVVEAGATIEDVNRRLDEQRSGLFFAPDPATLRQACIGGVIGNNAAGARSIKYGRTSENIAAVDAILADGVAVTFGAGSANDDARRGDLSEAVSKVVSRRRAQIAERFPKTIRRNAGYNLDMLLAQLDSAPDSPLDLAPLLCGSEGTLALTARARLKLHPKPIARGLAVVAFESLEEAIASVAAILETGPTAVEVIDDMVISLARRNLECNRYVDLLPRAHGKDPVAALYVEYSATDGGDTMDSSFAALRSACSGAPVQTHTDAKSMEDAWKLRQSGEPLLHGMPGNRKPLTFVEDNAVPTERLSEFVAGFKSILKSHETTAAFFAHASVGVLHVRPLISIRDDEDRRQIEPIARAAAELARSLGGVMSGEHGDGRARTPFLEWYYGAEVLDAFREIKQIFDPENLLNPGNIVDPQPTESIQTDLRIDAERVTTGAVGALETRFDYTEQHGLLGAIEACNGSALCRKRTGGTMCPSYMALGQERHATRGRANALRMAVTGQLSPGGAPHYNDQETIETLDLCLSCKACKAECPTNVDIARLKAEFTAQRFTRSGGPSLDTRLLARVRRLQRWAGVAPTIGNALLRFGPTRSAAKSVFGPSATRFTRS